MPISAIILTYNEEKNIERCLEHISSWVNEIIIVDSFSTDRTLEIAKRYTDKIYRNKYEGHPQQWQWTLSNVELKNDWVFAIDADFRITEELWREIFVRFSSLTDDISGFYVRHKEVFRGRPILHGGMYPNYWLRLFNKKKVSIDNADLVDIHFYVDGKTEKLEFDVVEQNSKDDNIFFWIEKQNRFAKRYAIEEIKRRKYKSEDYIVSPNFFGSLNQKKLFFKKIWYGLPLYVRPFFYFFYRYVIRLGFLDRKEGFIYHFTQGFLYRMLVDINIDENLNRKRKS